MPMKTSVPGSAVTWNRAVPRAEDTGTQSAPVDRLTRSLVRAKPDVSKVSGSDVRYPSVRCELSAYSSAPPPTSRPRPGNSRTTPRTRATMRPALQRPGGACRGAGGGLAVMASLGDDRRSHGPRLAPADLDQPDSRSTGRVRIGRTILPGRTGPCAPRPAVSGSDAES